MGESYFHVQHPYKKARHGGMLGRRKQEEAQGSLDSHSILVGELQISVSKEVDSAPEDDT